MTPEKNQKTTKNPRLIWRVFKGVLFPLYGPFLLLYRSICDTINRMRALWRALPKDPEIAKSRFAEAKQAVLDDHSLSFNQALKNWGIETEEQRELQIAELKLNIGLWFLIACGGAYAILTQVSWIGLLAGLTISFVSLIVISSFIWKHEVLKRGKHVAFVKWLCPWKQ